MEAGRHFDVLNPELSISPLAPLAATDAAMMAQAAQLFILSHEFGYVLFYRPPDEDDDLSTALFLCARKSLPPMQPVCGTSSAR
jgi:hypothetical protein